MFHDRDCLSQKKNHPGSIGVSTSRKRSEDLYQDVIQDVYTVLFSSNCIPWLLALRRNWWPENMVTSTSWQRQETIREFTPGCYMKHRFIFSSNNRISWPRLLDSDVRETWAHRRTGNASNNGKLFQKLVRREPHHARLKLSYLVATVATAIVINLLSQEERNVYGALCDEQLD